MFDTAMRRLIPVEGAIVFARRSGALPGVAIVVIAASIAPRSADGTTVINLPTNGVGSVATAADMGQSITVPAGSDTQLASFQFYGLGAGTKVEFEALVYEYNPATMATIGLPLYDSSLELAGPTLQTMAFATGGIDLTSGDQYLLDLHQEGYGNVGNLQLDDSDVSYSGGEFLMYSDYYGNWHTGIPQSLAFQAVFNPVPEPSTLALLGAALAGLAVLTAVHLCRRARA